MKMIRDGIIIITGTILTMILSSIIGVQKQAYKPSIQPRNAAFSIWAIIFACLILSGVYLAISQDSQLLPSILCLSSLLFCSLWLLTANTKYAFYILFSACACACASSILFKHSNDLQSSLILLGPNLLASWLTIAGALSFIIHLKEYWNISEQIWMPVPFLILNSGIAFTNTILGSYISSTYITFPVIWTAYFSSPSNIHLFVAPALIQIGFLIGYALHCKP